MLYRLMLLVFLLSTTAAKAEPLLDETFADTKTYEEMWKEVPIPGVDKETVFSLLENPTSLSIVSDAAASGVGYTERFLSKTPLKAAWRWRVDEFPKGADLTTKPGDDAAIRIQFLFFKERSAVGRLFSSMQKLLYDQEMPHRCLTYIWADRSYEDEIITNPYSEDVRAVVTSSSEKKGTWQSYEADVAADYKRAFDEELPPYVQIVVAGDSDNTESKSRAALDFIKLY